MPCFNITLDSRIEDSFIFRVCEASVVYEGPVWNRAAAISPMESFGPAIEILQKANLPNIPSPANPVFFTSPQQYLNQLKWVDTIQKI